jgi:hypothetical protein
MTVGSRFSLRSMLAICVNEISSQTGHATTLPE